VIEENRCAAVTIEPATDEVRWQNKYEHKRVLDCESYPTSNSTDPPTENRRKTDLLAASIDLSHDILETRIGHGEHVATFDVDHFDVVRLKNRKRM
ncbi:MAG: hypothetical protein ACREMY_21550, partial [bacterium]